MAFYRKSKDNKKKKKRIDAPWRPSDDDIEYPSAEGLRYPHIHALLCCTSGKGRDATSKARRPDGGVEGPRPTARRTAT